MHRERSRSASLPEEEALRLPRPPGAFRRFWAKHPVFADILLALFALLTSAAPATVFRTTTGTDGITVSETQLITANVTVTVLFVIACALLLRRRQWPLVATIGAYTVSVASILAQSTAIAGSLLLITSYSLAVYRSTRAAWTAFGIGSAAIALLSWALSGSILDLQNALNAVIGSVILTLIGTLIGVNVGGRKRYLEAIIDRSRQLLVERDQQAQIAASAERARIAREMHDIVSHSLTVIVALSEGAVATSDPTRARDASAAAAATARGALTEMRSMLGVLREGDAAAPLAPAEPVSPAASTLAAQQAGFPVVLTTRGAPASDPPVDFAIGRIVQEGLTNAMRHAPTATRIDVLVDRRADHVVIEVANDGVTGAQTQGGFGLRGLVERATHLGGTLSSRTDGPGRWLLTARLPMPDTDAAASAPQENPA